MRGRTTEEGLAPALAPTSRAAPAKPTSGSKASVETVAVAESTIGAGRLFARPSPAQLLKGDGKHAVKPARSTPEKATRVAVKVPQLASKNVAAEEHLKNQAQKHQDASKVVNVMASIGQREAVNVQQAAHKSVGTDGQLHKTHGTAELMKTSKVPMTEKARLAEGETALKSARNSSSKPSKNALNVSKGNIEGAGTHLQEVAQQPVPKSGKAVKSTVHHDDVQIGRLDPIPEESEGDWTSGSDTSEAEDGDNFANADSLLKEGNDSEGAESKQATKVRDPVSKGDTWKERTKGPTKQPNSGLQQLPLLKLDKQKTTVPKSVPFSRYNSLEEADIARETEVLRRQQIFDTADTHSSADLPAEIEGILKAGVVDKRRGKFVQSSEGHHTPTNQSDEKDSHADDDRRRGSSTWADFARERTKLLGEAVDDAEITDSGKAKFSLNPGVNDVLLWLRNIGWGQYEETFAINQIDFDELFILTDEDLEEMGMKLVSNRRMLLDAIAALKDVFLKEDAEGAERTEKIKSVFIDGRDSRENNNAELIADQVNYKQKSGYVTWSDYSGKKWKRGYAVIQGSFLHIFKSSDHVVSKPIFSMGLENSLISQSSQAQNCLYIQAESISVSAKDIYICGPDEEECDSWLQHLVAAASLQLLREDLTRNRSLWLSPVLIMIDEFHVNRTGPHALPRMEVKLTDKNGRLITKFNDIEFPDLVNDVLQPSAKGSISSALSEQVVVQKKLRNLAGPGAVIFFEFKHQIKDKSGLNSIEETQYWTYAMMDQLKHGNVKLDLLKKPPMYDPFHLIKGALPKKDKSFVALTVHVKDSKQQAPQDESTWPVPGVQNASILMSVQEHSQALLAAIRSKVDSADQQMISSMNFLQSVLESLHILDSVDIANPKAWGKISSKFASAANLIVKSSPARMKDGRDSASFDGSGDEKQNSTKPKDFQLEVQDIPQVLLGPGHDAPPPPPPPNAAVVSRYVNLATAQFPGPAPSMKMRPLHWKKVPPSESSDTVWSRVQAKEWNDVVDLIEPTKIEVLFSASQVVKPGDESARFKNTPKTALIDLRRAQNIEILLSRFHCTLKELKEAVLNLDASLLDVDKTVELMKFTPTDEEIEVLQSFKGNIAVLGSADRFFLEISEIPRYKERLQVHHLMLTFDDKCAELLEKVLCLNKCFSELMSSKRLHRFMLHILAVGNFMNHGTSMGNASAFRLEALNQATSIRSNVEGVTLLHFLASHIYNVDADLLKLPSDLPHLEGGALVSLTALSELNTSIERDLENARLELEKCCSRDVLKDKLLEFLPHSKNIFDNITKQMTKCYSLLKSTKVLYAETSPSVKQEEICRIFSTFKTELVSVMKENETARLNLVHGSTGSKQGRTQNEISHMVTSTKRDTGQSIVSMMNPWSESNSSPPSADGIANDVGRPSDVSIDQSGIKLDLEHWLVQHRMESYLSVLKLNRVTVKGLLELGSEDLRDLGFNDEDMERMLNAVAELRCQFQPGWKNPPPKAKKLAKTQAQQVPSTTMVATRSTAPIIEGPVKWGTCYGVAGTPSKGQKHGWIELQNRSKSWEKFYAKRSRNTLVLCISEADLNTAVRVICLDGVVVTRTEDKRPFVVEARKSIFNETKDDIILATNSSKEAASWEKALVKGSMWHAEARAAQQSSNASAAGGGLTAEQVKSVGHTFTFKGKSSRTQDNRNDDLGGAGSEVRVTQPAAASESLPYARAMSSISQSLSAGKTRGKVGVALRLVQVEFQYQNDHDLQNHVISITTTATVSGNSLLEPSADVQIRGLPSDEEGVVTIGVERAISIPDCFKEGPDLSVCLELRRKKPDSTITRAWTYLALKGNEDGQKRLQLYDIPVQLGVKKPSAVPLEGWFLTLDLQSNELKAEER